MVAVPVSFSSPNSEPAQSLPQPGDMRLSGMHVPPAPKSKHMANREQGIRLISTTSTPLQSRTRL